MKDQEMMSQQCHYNNIKHTAEDGTLLSIYHCPICPTVGSADKALIHVTSRGLIF